jgi:hypothetical protein
MLLNPIRRKVLIELERRYLDFELPGLIENPLAALERSLNEQPAENRTIEKPIFIVGCHRSGTTILYETLAQHPDLVYFTNASDLLPRIPILSNQLMGRMAGKVTAETERFVKDGLKITYRTPSEGVRIWERYVTNSADYCLDETYDNPQMEQYVRATIRKHLNYFKGKRFVNKNPDNSVRMRYLNKLFPDAYFIHIVRDGRAVCNSLLKFREAAADFFGPEHRYATSGVKVKAWSDIEKTWKTDPVTSIGLLWQEVMETVERDRQFIDAHRFLEFRYEDFLAQPLDYLQKIIHFCELPWTPTVEQIFQTASMQLSLGDRNDAWKKRLNPDDTERLMAIIGPKMQQYHYALT